MKEEIVVDKSKQMTLKDIQNSELEILIYIHDFCEKHGIKYTLGEGSLIGIVRHQDFIPWDDDTDILMTRENYNKFVELFAKETGKFRLFNYNTNPKYDKQMFQKVVNTETIALEPNQKTNKGLGVFCDIIPVDYIPDDKEKALKTCNRFWLYRRILISKTDKKISKSDMILRILFCYFSKKHFARKLDKYAAKTKPTKHMNNLAFITHSTRFLHFDASIFDEYILLPFRDRKFYVIKDYDTYLKGLFGNYMELPPEEERFSHNLDAFNK